MFNTGWPALTSLTFLPKPFIINLSDPLFGEILIVLQALARAAGCLAPPTGIPRVAFLTAIINAPLPLRDVAVLDELPQAQQAPRSPVSLEGLTLGRAGSGGDSGSGAGLSPRIRPCCDVSSWHARPSWFAVLEALRNAGYLLTTCATDLGPNTDAFVVARVAVCYLKAAFRYERLSGRFGIPQYNFVDASYKWSLETVNMQKRTDVGAGASVGTSEEEGRKLWTQKAMPLRVRPYS